METAQIGAVRRKPFEAEPDLLPGKGPLDIGFDQSEYAPPQHFDNRTADEPLARPAIPGLVMCVDIMEAPIGTVIGDEYRQLVDERPDVAPDAGHDVVIDAVDGNDDCRLAAGARPGSAAQAEPHSRPGRIAKRDQGIAAGERSAQCSFDLDRGRLRYKRGQRTPHAL